MSAEPSQNCPVCQTPLRAERTSECYAIFACTDCGLRLASHEHGGKRRRFVLDRLFEDPVPAFS